MTVGYRRTTMALLATEASVHVDTIYALVGRKPDIARELVEQALSGTDIAIRAQDREYVAAIRAEPDPIRKIAIYAAATAAMMARLAPMFLVLRDAGATDEAAASVWQNFSDRRAANMRDFIADLADSGGPLRAPYGHEMAADAVWATNSPDLYVLLTNERGWTTAQYEGWLADTWTRTLLGD